MDLEETEEKLQQYCQLWELYAKASCELTKRSKISQEEAANACKVLGPYIRDIMQEFKTVNTIFAMERELRGLKNRDTFPHTQNHTTGYTNWKLQTGKKEY